MRFVLKASPPNVSIGGPVPTQPGFPLKACGNDGLWIGNLLNGKLRGINPQRLNRTRNAALSAAESSGQQIAQRIEF